MLDTHNTASGLQVVLTPNRSLSWEGNKRVILFLGGVCLAIALGMGTILGVWLTLPFAGIEVLILGSTLYYVSWKLNYREIISFDGAVVRIEKSVYQPRRVYRFKKPELSLEVEQPIHDWEAQSINLRSDKGKSVSIGEFLGRDDADKLADLLRAALANNGQ